MISFRNFSSKIDFHKQKAHEINVCFWSFVAQGYEGRYHRKRILDFILVTEYFDSERFYLFQSSRTCYGIQIAAYAGMTEMFFL